MRRTTRGAGVLVTVGAALLLTACGSVTSAPAPVRTVTITASAAPSTTPAITTSPAPSPAAAVTPGDQGCAPNHVSFRVGMHAPIGDVDGDGRDDEELYSEDRPLRFGVRTASGATIVVDDDLPGQVHRGWVGVTEYGWRAVLDDEASARPYAFADCAFTRLTDPDGAPLTLRVGNPSGTRPTGAACTDQNGGTFLALSRAVERSDGRFDVYWGILQHDGEGYRADPVSGEGAYLRYRGLSRDDPRTVAAASSTCGDVPIVYFPDA